MLQRELQRWTRQKRAYKRGQASNEQGRLEEEGEEVQEEENGRFAWLRKYPAAAVPGPVPWQGGSLTRTLFSGACCVLGRIYRVTIVVSGGERGTWLGWSGVVWSGLVFSPAYQSCRGTAAQSLTVAAANVQPH